MKISALIGAVALVATGGLFGCSNEHQFGNGLGGSGGDAETTGGDAAVTGGAAAVTKGGSQSGGPSTGAGGETEGELGGAPTAEAGGEAGASPGSTTGPCDGEPCLNGGTCSTHGVTFTCACAKGFAGDTCDTNVDDCSPNPCKNGSCTDGIDSFSCTCFDGFSGTLCDGETNECLTNPCQNGGTCVDGPARYVCDCPTGYSGTNCELKISGCKDKPCLNGGTCSDGAVPPSYTCACPKGFAGNNCQIDVNDCDPNPCNGGMCTDKVAGFTCSNCPAGYTGATCSTDIDECLQNPCLHSGKCANAPGTFSCDCSGTGYTGTTCQSNVNECGQATSPCLHAGKCADTPGSFTCDCSGTGYSGTTCQTDVDECGQTPCQHSGKCANAPGTFSCDCSGTGYSGTTCQTDIDECAQTPCQHSGKCANAPGTFSCDCSGTGYTGTTCQTNVNECAAPTNPCQHGGKCADTAGSFTCDCSGTGYSGTTCQTDIDECAPAPCKNGGTCTQGVPGTYSCSCGARFVGKNCEFQKFRGIGAPQGGIDLSYADYVSGDGSVVAGTAISSTTNVHESIRFTGNTLTPVAIPAGFYSCVTHGLSQDGQILAGRCRNDDATDIRTFRQLAGGAPTFLTSVSTIANADCQAMSSDGNVFIDGGHLRWTSAGGWVDIAPGKNVSANALNSDGSILVGWNADTGKAWRWTASAAADMLVPAGGSDVRALGINPSGTVVVGTATIGGVGHAIRWTNGTPADLGVGSAADVSADGGVVVGDSGGEAAVWNSQGLSNLAGLLGNISDLNGWTPYNASSVSDDGKVITGTGDHNGSTEGFVVHLP